MKLIFHLIKDKRTFLILINTYQRIKDEALTALNHSPEPLMNSKTSMARTSWESLKYVRDRVSSS